MKNIWGKNEFQWKLIKNIFLKCCLNLNKRFTNYDCCWPRLNLLARFVNSLLSPRPKRIPSDISRNLQMSPNFNQNTRWILRSIFEVIKILVVNSRPLSHGLCDQWGHGVIWKHNISKKQGLMNIAFL